MKKARQHELADLPCDLASGEDEIGLKYRRRISASLILEPV